MKKSILKASLICLGIALLCGMSSFKTSEGVKSPRSNASIIYDTIITPEGEVSRVIKEVVVELDRSGCSCSLKVSYGQPGCWNLYFTNGCTRRVHAICEYQIYGIEGDHDEKTKTKEITISGNRSEPIVSGSLDNSVCEVIDLRVCFADLEGPNNQNQ